MSVVEQITAAVTVNPLADPANLSNSVTGIYGITGSGKSSLADTGIEYCFETFGKISLVYAADLGGYGTKRLALIRQGIALVYDPRNHIDPFSTMELCSLGAFPAYLLPGGGASREDRERGYAPPDCELVLPHRRRYTIQSANGEQIAQVYDIPTAQTLVQQHIGSQLVTEVVRSKGFAHVGHRVYDSMTALNDWGMNDLQEQSAKGILPASNDKGGRALGSADALVSGQFRFAGSSIAQYGFLQNRSYGWLANIRSIPDQVVPATVTFMVEKSKGDDESGGAVIYGPKIAGNARTSALGGWLGNLLYAAFEPDQNQVMVRRLWLENHVDPRDLSGIPYVAKHRGTPLGMPQYLEDAPGSAPWSTCSLGVLFHKLNDQIAQVEAALKVQFPNAPGMPMTAGEEAETVVRAVTSSAAVPTSAASGLRPVGTLPQPSAQPAPSLPAKRGLRVSAPAPVAAPAAPAAPSPAPPPAPSASGATGTATTAPTAPQPVVVAATDAPAGGAAVVPVPATAMPPTGAPLQPATPRVANTSATPRLATRSRVPRPPV